MGKHVREWNWNGDAVTNGTICKEHGRRRFRRLPEQDAASDHSGGGSSSRTRRKRGKRGNPFSVNPVYR